MPTLPPAIIFTTVFVYKFVQQSLQRERAVKILALTTFAFVAISLQFFLPKYAEHDSVKQLFTAANELGYKTESVANLHTISHNAEFYGAARIVRSEDGKIRKFLGVTEIIEQLNLEDSKSLLVLVPVDFLHELSESNQIESRVIQENSELGIVLVRLK